MDKDILDVFNKLIDSSNQAITKADGINKRLIVAIITLSICFAVTVSCMAGFYFFADYQYPTTEQVSSQTDGQKSQEVKQNIK